MKDYTLRIILFVLIVWSAKCASRRKKSDTTQTFHRNGEAIALANLIEIYENEHQKLYQQESKDDHLEWPNLEIKNLTKYCMKYLQQVVPKRSFDSAIGVHTKNKLYYEKHNTTTAGVVAVIMCKIMYKNYQVVYYMTRALEPNCTYALKCTGNWAEFIFTIINKYCDFEDKPFNRSFKWKRGEMVSRIHRSTGQPIATGKYLLKYELEHQEMLRTAGNIGKYIEWLRTNLNKNLNSYCYEYMSICAPNRRRDGITGSWSIGKLNYQKFKTDVNINVTTVKCMVSGGKHYYMTRAPEANCVYGLLRKSHSVYNYFVIAFKYCDFEHPNHQQTKEKNYNILDKNVILKTEAKNETTDILELRQFFPLY